MKCPYCGSVKTAINPLTGEVVCQLCGTVIVENPIEDEPYIRQEYTMNQKTGIKRIWRERLYRKKVAGLETSHWGKQPDSKKPSAQHNEAIKLDLIELVRRGLPKHRVFKARTINAIAVYVKERSEGASKKSAIQVASATTGVSVKTLERIIREYRDWVEEVVRRAARE
ncbi:MAG: TFIIB-type zinc ribbon-containing protein [Desulfurococcales archaeon]|nr:TFIIB-type zinc ribbon-containing protein [Desulfurococcales archaeon]